MEFPYQRLRTGGNVLVAAQAARIHTFSLRDGSHLGSWSHPKAASSKTAPEGENGAGSAVSAVENQENGAEERQVSSAKRRKIEAGDGPGGEEPEAQASEATGQGAQGAKTKNYKGKKHNHAGAKETRAEPPIVTALELSPDSRHVVAVTGQDKTIWVLAHDDNGTLTQLSTRVMPKRPCAVAVTPDGQSIISADKFGDVYSLPLLAADSASGADGNDAPRPLGLPPSKPVRLEANEFTVHSRRNLESLQHQKRQKELRAQAATQPSTPDPSAAVTTDAALLLGHVSMLTALALASTPGPGSGGKQRRYVVTADRDEHIRVSRAPPQAHVVEAFCLGHGDFVSALCLPRPGRVLVSGGGDADLFVWDWAAGRLLSRAPLLPLLPLPRAVAPDASRLAVTTLCAAPGPGGPAGVYALCERVPAVFCFQLEGEALELRQTVRLPGNPLDMAVFEDGAAARMIVATIPPSQDPAGGEEPSEEVKGPGLLFFDLRPTTGWTASGFQVQDAQLAEAGKPDFSLPELEKLLFTTEVLRKQPMGDSEDVDAEP